MPPANDTHAAEKWLVAYRGGMGLLMAILITFVGFVGRALIDNTATNALAIVRLQEQVAAATVSLQSVASTSFTSRDAAAAEARQRLVDAGQDAEFNRQDRRLGIVEDAVRTRGLKVEEGKP